MLLVHPNVATCDVNVRLVKNIELWACMACMALNGKNLAIAEEALAAVQEVNTETTRGAAY